MTKNIITTHLVSDSLEKMVPLRVNDSFVENRIISNIAIATVHGHTTLFQLCPRGPIIARIKRCIVTARIRDILRYFCVSSAWVKKCTKVRMGSKSMRTRKDTKNEFTKKSAVLCSIHAKIKEYTTVNVKATRSKTKKRERMAPKFRSLCWETAWLKKKR